MKTVVAEKSFVAALILATATVAASAHASPALGSERAGHIESCAAKLGTAQVATREGRAYCGCMIDELEREFGAAALTQAVDPIDIQQYMQRLLVIVNACAHLLPKTDSP
ncbi:MAG: hypothetical protein V3U43_00265 [Pseudomonadales bacterium]